MTRYDFDHSHGGELDRYYASADWAQTKARFFSRHQRRCEACGSGDRIDLHHADYADLYPGEDGDHNDSNLVALCRNCHAECHYHQKRLGLPLHNMTGEFMRLRREQSEREALSAANEQLRHQQDRLRGREATPSPAADEPHGGATASGQFQLFGSGRVVEQPTEVHRVAPSRQKPTPRVDVGTNCGVCGGGDPGLEPCVTGDAMVHGRCSYQKRTPVCSVACSVGWLEATGH